LFLGSIGKKERRFMRFRVLFSILLVSIVLFQGLAVIPQNAQAYIPNRVIVLVDPDIIDGIQENLNQYIYDIYQMGYVPEIVSKYWNSPEKVREFLAEKYMFGLVGVVIMGDIPSALYETEESDDFILEPGMEEFPIDLFYMDVDGDWMDTDGNGIYDSHFGSKNPEIWVGRITAATLSGDEVDLTNRYLEKVHSYRIGDFEPNNRALMYIDDDWVLWANEWRQDLNNLYSDTIMIANPTATNGDQYKTHLERDYEWIHLAAHSSEDSHHFKVMKVWQLRAVTSDDIMSICPNAYYYNLFACSSAKYTSPDYIAGCYIFSDSLGIAAVGSTKTGAMKEFGDFYKPLGDGDTMGEAFLHWFKIHGLSDPNWYYGLTIIGDPTLGPKVSKVQGGDQAPSNQRPILTIQSPQTGDVISGSNKIEGSAWDDKEVVSVWVRIDSQDWKKATGTLSWSYIWDTSKESSGFHTITARANDGEIYSDEVSLSVTVKDGNVNPGDDDKSNDTTSKEEENLLFGFSLFYVIVVASGVGIIAVAVVTILILIRRRSRYETLYS
jgi:hypothetical protein